MKRVTMLVLVIHAVPRLWGLGAYDFFNADKVSLSPIHVGYTLGTR